MPRGVVKDYEMEPNCARTVESPSRASTRYGSDVSLLHLSRGPILIGAGISFLLFPFVAEFVSTKMIILLGIMMIGFVWFCHDLYRFLTRGLRFVVNHVLDSIVLDDLLRAIFDPETGLVACLVASFVGTSSMYALRMSPDQRTRLVKASLYMPDEDQAHTVLMEPGGYKFLLPEKVQDWLNSGELDSFNIKFPNDDQEPSMSFIQESCRQPDITAANSRSISVDHGSEVSTSDCDITDFPEQEDDNFFLESPGETNLRKGVEPSFCDDEYLGRDTDHHPDHVEEEKKLPQRMASESDPMTEFVRILKDLATQRLRSHVRAMPVVAIENLGMASIAALAIQSLLGRKSKATRLLGATSAVIFSSIATFSFGAIVSRHVILGTIHNKKTLQLACKDVAVRVWDKLKAEIRTRKTKTFVAMVVLCMIGRQKRSTKLSTSSRP
jgi:hypothetical protein